MPQNDLTAEDRARELGARERYSWGAYELSIIYGLLPKYECRVTAEGTGG